MKRFSSIIFILIILSACNNSSSDKTYNTDKTDITSTPDVLNFYNLKKILVEDSTNNIISIHIPDNSSENIAESNEIARFQVEYSQDEYLDILIRSLRSQYTVRFNNADEYISIIKQGIKEKYGDNIQALANVFPTRYTNIRIVSIDYDYIINNHSFMRRIMHFNDKLTGDLNNTNFQFITWHNKQKYTFDITYTGDNKTLPELIGFTNSIAGSLKFLNN